MKEKDRLCRYSSVVTRKDRLYSYSNAVTRKKRKDSAAIVTL